MKGETKVGGVEEKSHAGCRSRTRSYGPGAVLKCLATEITGECGEHRVQMEGTSRQDGKMRGREEEDCMHAEI